MKEQTIIKKLNKKLDGLAVVVRIGAIRTNTVNVDTNKQVRTETKTVCFIQLTRDCTRIEAHNIFKSCKRLLKSSQIEGFVLLETPEKYRIIEDKDK